MFYGFYLFLFIHPLDCVFISLIPGPSQGDPEAVTCFPRTVRLAVTEQRMLGNEMA